MVRGIQLAPLRCRRGQRSVGGVLQRTVVTAFSATPARPQRLPAAAPLVALWAGLSTSAISTRNTKSSTIGTVMLSDTRQLEVLWDDGHTSDFDWTWLRINCPSFVHKSGHRTVFPGDVPPGLQPLEVSATDSHVTVTWSDGHVSTYATGWLRAHDHSPSALHERRHGSWPTPLCAWDAIPKVDGPEYMENDETLYAALRKINHAGMVVLENVGVKERSVLNIARRVAPISHQALYGEVFDVVAQENARNMAYTNERLRLHMDLVYYESPPGLQFLHCLDFDPGVEGGETIFLDAFAAAHHLRENNPEMFEVLSRVSATFEKIRAAAPHVDGDDRNVAALKASHIEYQRPHFQVDTNGDLLSVTWAPMFEGVLLCAPKDMALYHAAHGEFLRLIEEGPYAAKHTIRKRLKPGQCLIFNNRRMLHGREAFTWSPSPSSSHDEHRPRRWLQGCYVNADDALSRLCSLRVARLSSPLTSYSSLTTGGGGGGGGDALSPDYVRRVGNGSLPLVC